MTDRKDIILCGVLVFICLLFCISAVDNTMPWDGDNIQIFHQMLAFLTDSTKDFLSKYEFLCNMSDDSIAMKAYSWGTSIIISPIYYIAGFKYLILYKFVIIAFYLLFIAFLYFFFKKKFGYLLSFLSALVFASCTYLIYSCNDIMKDIQFAACVLICAYFWEKLFCEDNNNRKQKIIYSAVFTLFLFLCVFFRENGFFIYALFLTASVIKICEKKLKKETITLKNQVSVLLPYLTVLIIYLIFNLKYPVLDDKNLSAFDFSINSIKDMTLYYMRKLSESFCYFGKEYLNYSFLIYLTGLFLLGFIKNFKKEIISSILVLSFVFFICFTMHQGIRYIYYILPFFLIFICCGIRDIKNKKIKISLTVLFSVFSFMEFLNSCNDYLVPEKFTNKFPDYGALSSDSTELYDYIKKNTPEDSVFITSHPRMILLFTGRNSFQVSHNWDKYKQADYQVSIYGDNNPGEYYVKELMFDYKERTFVEKCGVYLNPIYINKNYILYKIEKE